VFNAVLARRVCENNWSRAIAGDVFMFGNSHSFFCESPTDEIVSRLARLDIHPSGPLWGKGTPATTDTALALETEIAESQRELCEGLERAGMEMARRPLRLAITDFNWRFPDENSLIVAFSLPAGAYATAVLREIVDFQGNLD
jgi:tRNA pseudouridine13 synthase